MSAFPTTRPCARSRCGTARRARRCLRPPASSRSVQGPGLPASRHQAARLARSNFSVGLAGFLWQPKGSLKSKIPFYIGGEECYCSREWTAPLLRGTSEPSIAARSKRPTSPSPSWRARRSSPNSKHHPQRAAFGDSRSRPTRAWHRAHPVMATPITWPMAKVTPAAAKPTSN